MSWFFYIHFWWYTKHCNFLSFESLLWWSGFHSVFMFWPGSDLCREIESAPLICPPSLPVFPCPPSLCLRLILPIPTAGPFSQGWARDQWTRMGGVDDRQTGTTWTHKQITKYTERDADVISGSRQNTLSWCSRAIPSPPVWDDHNTNMWGFPAAPQAARKHLHKASSRPCSPHSHMGEHVRQALCCCHRFCSFPPLRLSLCLDGTARHPDRQHSFITVPLMLSDQSFCRGERSTDLATLPPKTPIPLCCFCARLPWPLCKAPGRAPSPLGVMEDSQRSVCEVQL